LRLYFRHHCCTKDSCCTGRRKNQQGCWCSCAILHLFLQSGQNSSLSKTSPRFSLLALLLSHFVETDSQHFSGTILEITHWRTVRPAPTPMVKMLIGAPAYMVEIFPYAERSRGISIEQYAPPTSPFHSRNVNARF
jgi:hypothetical protein